MPENPIPISGQITGRASLEKAIKEIIARNNGSRRIIDGDIFRDAQRAFRKAKELCSPEMQKKSGVTPELVAKLFVGIYTEQYLHNHLPGLSKTWTANKQKTKAAPYPKPTPRQTSTVGFKPVNEFAGISFDLKRLKEKERMARRTSSTNPWRSSLLLKKRAL
ncbi:MAG TPA: hypothetical protein VJH23_06670 [archaeon]|nr:hypothetical protein [archaeon]